MERKQSRQSKGNKQKVSHQIRWSQAWWFAPLLFLGAALLIWFISQTEREVVITKPQPSYMVIMATVTAYTSDEKETDNTPFVTAHQTLVEKGVAACPRNLPFGTRIEIDGQAYRCEDRTHFRLDGIFDLWMESKNQAFQWGRQIKEIIIYEESF